METRYVVDKLTEAERNEPHCKVTVHAVKIRSSGPSEIFELTVNEDFGDILTLTQPKMVRLEDPSAAKNIPPQDKNTSFNPDRYSFDLYIVGARDLASLDERDLQDVFSEYFPPNTRLAQMEELDQQRLGSSMDYPPISVLQKSDAAWEEEEKLRKLKEDITVRAPKRATDVIQPSAIIQPYESNQLPIEKKAYSGFYYDHKTINDSINEIVVNKGFTQQEIDRGLTQQQIRDNGLTQEEIIDRVARKILTEIQDLSFKFPDVPVIGYPIYTTHVRSLQIRERYHHDEWETGINAIENPVAARMEKLMQMNDYRNLRSKVEFLPITSYKNYDLDFEPEGPTQESWVRDDLHHIDQFMQEGGVLFGIHAGDALIRKQQNISKPINDIIQEKMQDLKTKYGDKVEEKNLAERAIVEEKNLAERAIVEEKNLALQEIKDKKKSLEKLPKLNSKFQSEIDLIDLILQKMTNKDLRIKKTDFLPLDTYIKTIEDLCSTEYKTMRNTQMSSRQLSSLYMPIRNFLMDKKRSEFFLEVRNASEFKKSCEQYKNDLGKKIEGVNREIESIQNEILTITLKNSKQEIETKEPDQEVNIEPQIKGIQISKNSPEETIFNRYINKYTTLLNGYIDSRVLPKEEGVAARKPKGALNQIKYRSSHQSTLDLTGRIELAEFIQKELGKCKTKNDFNNLSRLISNKRRTLRGTNSDLISIMKAMEYDIKHEKSFNPEVTEDKARNPNQEAMYHLESLLRVFLRGQRSDISENRVLNIKADTLEDYLRILKAESDHAKGKTLRKALNACMDYVRINHSQKEVNSILRTFERNIANELLSFVSESKGNEADSINENSISYQMKKAGELAHAILKCQSRTELDQLIDEARLLQAKLITHDAKNSKKLVGILDKFVKNAAGFTSDCPTSGTRNNIDKVWSQSKENLEKANVDVNVGNVNIDVIYDAQTHHELTEYLNYIKSTVQNGASLEQLKNDKDIGSKLYQQLVKNKAHLSTLTTEEFVGLLLKGNEPYICAETKKTRKRIQKANDWTPHEAYLMGNIARKVNDVTAYTTKTYGPKLQDVIKSERKPTCDLLLIDGALLNAGNPLDIGLVTNENGDFDEKKYKALLTRRFLPALCTVSGIMTLPTVGGDVFAGRFKKEITGCFSRVIQQIITENAASLTNIKAFIHTGVPLKDDELSENCPIPFISTKKTIGLTPALDKDIFHEIKDPALKAELQNCPVTVVIAADRFSFPGNDAYKGAPTTQEGGVSLCTNALERMTKLKGFFDETLFKFKPDIGYLPDVCTICDKPPDNKQLKEGRLYFYVKSDGNVAFKVVKEVDVKFPGEVLDQDTGIRAPLTMEKLKNNFDLIMKLAGNAGFVYCYKNLCQARNISLTVGNVSTLSNGQIITKDLSVAEFVCPPEIKTRQCAIAVALSHSKKNARLGYRLIEEITPRQIETLRNQYPAEYYAQLFLSRLQSLEMDRHKNLRNEIMNEIQGLQSNNQVSIENLNKIIKKYQAIAEAQDKKGLFSSVSRFSNFLGSFIKDIPIINSNSPKPDQVFAVNDVAKRGIDDLMLELAKCRTYINNTQTFGNEFTWAELKHNSGKSHQLILQFLADYDLSYTDNQKYQDKIASYDPLSLAMLKYFIKILPPEIEGCQVKNKLINLYIDSFNSSKRESLGLSGNDLSLTIDNQTQEIKLSLEKLEIDKRTVSEANKSANEKAKATFIEGIRAETQKLGNQKTLGDLIAQSLNESDFISRRLEKKSTVAKDIQFSMLSHIEHGVNTMWERYGAKNYVERTNTTVDEEAEGLNYIPTQIDRKAVQLANCGFSQAEINQLTPYERVVYDAIIHRLITNAGKFQHEIFKADYGNDVGPTALSYYDYCARAEFYAEIKRQIEPYVKQNVVRQYSEMQAIEKAKSNPEVVVPRNDYKAEEDELPQTIDNAILTDYKEESSPKTIHRSSSTGEMFGVIGLPEKQQQEVVIEAQNVMNTEPDKKEVVNTEPVKKEVVKIEAVKEENPQEPVTKQAVTQTSEGQEISKDKSTAKRTFT